MPKKPGSPEASTHDAAGLAASSRQRRVEVLAEHDVRAAGGASAASTARPPATTLAAASSGSVPGGTRAGRTTPEDVRSQARASCTSGRGGRAGGSGGRSRGRRRASGPAGAAAPSAGPTSTSACVVICAPRGCASPSSRQRAADHDLVRPARPVDDGARRRRARSRPSIRSACSSRGRRTERKSAIVVPWRGERRAAPRWAASRCAVARRVRISDWRDVGDRQLLPERGRGGRQRADTPGTISTSRPSARHAPSCSCSVP